MDQGTLQDSTQGQILAITLVFPCLAFIAVSLRLYTRLLLIKSASYEDAFITVAFVHFGLGKRLAAVNPSNYESYFKYLRICVKGRVKKATYAVLALVVAYGIETLFSGTFTCYPVAYFWNQTIPGGHCINKWPLYFTNAGINILSDFLILILPIFILKSVQIPKLQKIILMTILALGGIAGLASIFRLYLLYKLSKSSDFLWDGPGTATWSIIEVNVAIICASISTLRPLLSRMLPTLFGSFQRPSYDRNKYISTSDHTKPKSSASNFDPFAVNDDEQALRNHGNVELSSQPSYGNIKVTQEYDVEHV